MLDALEDAPQVWCVLTTVDPRMGPKDLWKPLEQTVRAVRRRFPDFQYACLPEYTTGMAPRSGGHRRLHLNLVIKGVPPDRADELQDVLRRLWSARTGADQVYVGELRAVGGVIRYLALHFQKPGQAPPTGWAGHRVRFSRGYLVRPASIMREEARESLREKRRVWRARKLFPEAPAELIEAIVQVMREQDHARRWYLVEVREFDADGMPLRWERLRLRPHGRWWADDAAPPDDDWLDTRPERNAWWSGLVPADLVPPFVGEMPELADVSLDSPERP